MACISQQTYFTAPDKVNSLQVIFHIRKKSFFPISLMRIRPMCRTERKKKKRKKKGKARGSHPSSAALESWRVQFLIFIISLLVILNPFNTPLLVLWDFSFLIMIFTYLNTGCITLALLC